MKNKEIKILVGFRKYLLIHYYSSKTIDGYCINIKIFFEFLIDYYNLQINVQDINVSFLSSVGKSEITNFLYYLDSYRYNNVDTRKRYVASIKCFYAYLYKKYPSIIAKDIIPDIYSQQTKRIPKYISLDKAIELKTIFNEKNCKFYKRNNLIISTFLVTGVRLSELVSLNISDINFKTKSAKIVGKGNKEINIYFTTKLLCDIQSYLRTRQDDYPALFVTEKGRINKITVQNIVKRAYELAEISDYGYTTHTLRHTAATYMYKQTHDILLVKEFLGHSSISTTSIYTHINNIAVRKLVNRHPLSSSYSIKKTDE